MSAQSGNLEKSQNIGGFTVLDVLGRGASGIVYRALRDERVVALKLMHESALSASPAAAAQFRREAVALARIRHPALVDILETGVWEGRPYLVMEFVDGESLEVRLRRGALSESEILLIGESIASALAQLHQAGFVHRDLKPANILLCRDGSVKLVDLGLVTGETAQPEGTAAGTFVYTAPEQAGMIKRPVDGRADLYGLGVVLYECASGRPPFSSPDIGELLRLHATAEPPILASLRPELSSKITGVISRLLQKDPDDRFAHAAQLLQALVPTEVQTPGPAFVGREKELEILLNRVSTCKSGRGSVVLISGEAGSGKSRLVREAIVQSKRNDLTVLAGKCEESNPLPLLPFRNAIETALRARGDHARLIPKVRAAAKGLEAVLSRFSPDLGKVIEAPKDPTELSQRQFIHGVVDFFERLAPVVLAIDDIQWLDDTSREVLARLGEARAPVLAILTSRNDDKSSHALGSIRTELALDVDLTMEPLSDSAVAALVSSSLGGRKVDPHFCERIARISGGSPLAVEVYLSAMLDEGILRPSWGSWLVDLSGLERLNLPNNVIGLILKRTESLGEEARHVLESAAIIGTHFDPALVAEVMGIPDARARAGIAELERARLVETLGPDEYLFVHDRVLEAALSRLNENSRKILHQRVAEALDRHSEPTFREAVTLARHYSLGLPEKNPERAYHTNLTAGTRSLEEFADDEAYGFLTVAQALATRFGMPQDADLLESLGIALYRKFQLTQASEVLLRAVEVSKNPEQRARVRTQLVDVYITFGYPKPGQAWPLILKALEDVGAPHPKSPIAQLLHTGFDIARTLLGLLLNRKGKTVSSARVERLTFLYCHGARAAYSDGLPLIFPQMMFRSLATALKGPASRAKVEAFTNLSIFVSIAIKSERICKFLLNRARQTATQVGDPSLNARIDLYDAFTTTYRGDPVHGESQVSKCLEKYIRWLDIWDYHAGCLDLGYNLLLRGYAREASAVDRLSLQRVRVTGREPNLKDLSPFVTMAGLSRALLGDIPGAVECLNRQREEAQTSRTPSRIALATGYRLLFLLEQGEYGEEAENEIAAYRNLNVPAGLTVYHWHHYYLAQAYVRTRQYEAASPSDRDTYRPLLRIALEEFSQSGRVPVFQTHYWIMRAIQYRVDGKIRKAARCLARAEELAHRADSPWAHFLIHIERAKTFKTRGLEGSCRREAIAAAGIADFHGWAPRLAQVARDFSISSEVETISSRATNGTLVSSIKDTIRADALLRLSLASVGSVEIEGHVQAILDELLRILGAERAFLFLKPDQDGDQEIQFGRQVRSDGTIEAAEVVNYSRTLLNLVEQSLTPRILSGTEEAESIGAESAIAHGLRSIIAAPLIVRDRLLGTAYLDNRMAKGVFSNDDIGTLQALANHLAVGLETARASRSEFKRRELEKDMAVTAAVQSMFLPATEAFAHGTFTGTGFYTPAEICGGDWWWYEKFNDGRLLVCLGDVTGHGPGPAMVTAAMLGVLRSPFGSEAASEVDRLLWGLDRTLQNLSSGKYLVCLTALLLDPVRAEGTVWTAGGLPVLRCDSSGKLNSFGQGSAPLGLKNGETYRETFPISPGDRLLIYSDGLVDAGLRAPTSSLRRVLHRVLVDSCTHDLAQTRGGIVQFAKDNVLSGAGAADDVTFVLVEWNR